MHTEDGPRLTSRERLRFTGVLCGLLIVALLAHCSGCFSPKHLPDAAPTMSDPAVVQLRIEAAPLSVDTGGTCTAWKVDNGLIMTAGHCCEAKDPTTAFLLQGRRADPGSSAQVLYVDKKHDICVLSGNVSGAPIAIALRDPDLGETVWTAGYPHGTFLISSGYWAGRERGADGEWAVCSTTVKGGASGSPVMDSRGRAVGVIVAGYRDMDGLTFAATTEWMRLALIRARFAAK